MLFLEALFFWSRHFGSFYTHCSQSLLVGPNLIDEVYKAREELFLSIALLFGAMVLSPKYPTDLWICLGISSFLADSWLRRLHGENWGRMRLRAKMELLCDTEVDSPALSIAGPLDDLSDILQGPGGSQAPSSSSSSSKEDGEKTVTSTNVPPTLEGILSEESFFEFYLLKSGLIFRAIEGRIGPYAMAKTLSTLPSFIHSLARDQGKGDQDAIPSVDVINPTPPSAPPPSFTGGGDASLITLVTSGHFFRLVRKVSGKDLRPFADQWIYAPGHAQLHASFGLNRKKCCLEIRISQNCAHPDRGGRFCGPLKIRVQEADQYYDHVVHIEDTSHFFELPYHSKYKKSTAGGLLSISSSGASGSGGSGNASSSAPIHLHPIEESSSATLGIDQIIADESPVQWVRLDPQMEWMRKVVVEQPEFMWIEQLENDRDVISQAEVGFSPFTIILIIGNWRSCFDAFRDGLFDV